nr:MAG TPA: hypothetical protein [Caudoviricetes sp.]
MSTIGQPRIWQISIFVSGVECDSMSVLGKLTLFVSLKG